MNAKELFFSTIQSGKADHIEAQLTHNPSLVNTKDARGFTPLIFATYFDMEEVAKVLIEHNAEIEGQDTSGNTALMGVCFKGNPSIANLLIENGADVNAQNLKGVTPLIFATMYNKVEVVELLLKNGADIAIKDKDKKTAFSYAKEKGFDAILKLLN